MRTLENQNAGIERGSANFHPSIWGDYFLEYTCDIVTLDGWMQEVENLKEEVRKMLKMTATEPSKHMKLINALQVLGVAYQFEMEIEEAIKQLYDHAHDFFNNIDNNLYDVALYFQLLRRQGYDVSCDVLTKFIKDDKDSFKSSLLGDVKGMLSLFEATHLRVHGEDILEESYTFTTAHLKEFIIMDRLSYYNLGRQVQHALEQPLYRGMPRLEAWHYISSLYQENDEKWSNCVTKLAKLDFNLLQSLHRKELSDVSRWWKNLDFASKLPFARNRLVECYFWIIGVYFEHQYSFSRVMLTKVIALASVIDDIFDVYGTVEELQLFTNAIERLEPLAINQLPEYMKVCYKALVDVYDEVEKETSMKGESYQLYYAKEAMKDLVQAYFVEAKWFNEGYVPKMEEYMRNGLVSSGYYMVVTTSFVGMGKTASKEALEWVRKDPNAVVRASCLIARFMDDVVSHKFEQKRGHVSSSVECYMKQYNVSEPEAIDELNKMVEEAWKDLNQGSLRPTDVPMPLLQRIVNLARMIYVIYKHEDGYTNSHTKLKECITKLLVNPVPLEP